MDRLWASILFSSAKHWTLVFDATDREISVLREELSAFDVPVELET